MTGIVPCLPEMIQLLEVRTPLSNASESGDWPGRCLWQCRAHGPVDFDEMSEQIRRSLERLAPGLSLVLAMHGRLWLLARRAGQPGFGIRRLD